MEQLVDLLQAVVAHWLHVLAVATLVASTTSLVLSAKLASTRFPGARFPAFRKMRGPDPAVYELSRQGSTDYKLLRKFRYVVPNDPSGRRFIVPADTKSFTTDFASVPAFATWLVPRDGTHTPAALLHDALIRDRPNARTVIVGGEPVKDGHDADRIFRNAMGHLGVALIRRWMMWAAVSLRTLVQEGRLHRRAWWWLVIVITIPLSMTMGVRTLGDLVYREQSWRPGFLESGIFRGNLPWVLLAVASLLWFRRIGVGAITIASVIVFSFPLLVSFLGFLAYFIAESVVWITLIAYRDAFERGPIAISSPKFRGSVTAVSVSAGERDR